MSEGLVSRFENLGFEGWDWSVTKPDWQLDLLIPARSIGMVFGASNSGKSHLICDMIMSTIQGGGEWQGREQVGGSVVMFSESLGHIQARMKAYRSRTGLEPKYPLHLFGAMSISCYEVDELAAYIGGLFDPPALLVFDTFSTSFDLGEAGENDNSAVAKLLRRLEERVLPMMHKRGAIVIVHHTSKASGGTTARGASALVGNIDWSIQVAWDKDLSATVAKWEKDRWRLCEDSPTWAGKAERMEVEFTNGTARMMVLNWEEIDEAAQEAAQQLEKEKALENAQAAVVAACRAKINEVGFAFIKTNRNAKVATEFQSGEVRLGEFTDKANQGALRDWVDDKMATFAKGAIHSKHGAFVGWKLTEKGK